MRFLVCRAFQNDIFYILIRWVTLEDKAQIWQLESSITIWYIWKARCLKVFQNMIERPAQIIYGIWTEISHNLIGLLDSIKGNMQQVELK